MVGLTRRHKVEGWALDVAETSAEVGRSTVRQRLAENNKLWIVCLAVVVLVSMYLVRAAERGPNAPLAPGAVRQSQATYDDERHRAFEQSVLTRRYGKLGVVEARFVAPDTFRITVESGLNRDDTEFLARTIGMRIAKEFRFRPVVHAYALQPDGSSMLVATAQWEPKSYGFMTRPIKKKA